MFDFENLTVYKKSREYNKQINSFLMSTNFDRATKDQLRRASLSVMLNIAEGSGRNSKRDKRHFYVMSRGSAFECAAVFDYLKEVQIIDKNQHYQFYQNIEELSKMLYSIIRSLS